MTKAKDGSHWICRCDCGGQVRGIMKNGRVFEYCTIGNPKAVQPRKAAKRHHTTQEQPK